MIKEYDDFLINYKTISLKIPIHADVETRDFIFKNINMYRRIKNDFIEAANAYFNMHHTYKGFSVLKFKNEYFKKEQEEGRYSEYVRGLSEQVAKEIDTSIKSILTNYDKSDKMGRFHFRRFDKYRGSFTTHLKPTFYKVADDIHYSSRITQTPDNKIVSFKVRGSYHGDKEEVRHFHLKEPLYDDIIRENDKNHIYVKYFKEDGLKTIHEYRFRGKDIKLITFIHELGHFYIQFSIDVTYIIYRDIVKDRIYKAGIDTGIHNPAVVFDGIEFKYIRMDEKKIARINRIESRIKYLQERMDIKYRINKKRVKSGELKTPYSKNYEKLRYKFRKSWKRIVNIKRQWRYDVCKRIVTSYRHIVVDGFEQPDNTDVDLTNDVIHAINSGNRFHAMYLFNETLKHMADKYGCYYYEAPENTTRICSECGYKNKPLPLTKRYLVCKKCGVKIDRDVNAAINCFIS